MPHGNTPVRDGFAAVLHEPALLAAELTWRWCFGFSAIALSVCSVALFLKSISLSRADQFLLGTLQPALLAATLKHVFQGSLPRLLLEQALLLLGLTLMWSFAAAVGRAATLNRLLAMFSISDEPQPQNWHFWSLFLLELLRAMWTQIAIAVTVLLAATGAVLAGRQRPVVAAASLSFGVGCACLAGFALNWYMGTAPLFCLRNGVSAREALEQTATFSRECGGHLARISSVFLLIRTMWAAALGFVFVAPLELAGKTNGRWIALLMGLAALVYFVGADALRLARWGAYVALLEEPSEPVMSANEPVAPSAAPDLLPLEGLA